MKIVPLTKGKMALVDDADYPEVSRFKWHAQRAKKLFYAARKSPRVGGKQSIILLHRFLLPGIARVDHKNGNGLDNRRDNLRPGTVSQNARGFQHKRARTTSKFRGVSKDPLPRKTWRAVIGVRGKNVYLGSFGGEIEAARAYDVAAKKYFRDFASLNFNRKKK